VSTPGQIPGAPPTQVAAGGDRFSIVADTRTNSLLLRSDSAGRIAQLSALIARLDVPARAIGSTRVIYLKHAEAERMVEVLRGMLAGEARATAAAAAPTLAASGRPAAAARGQEASLIQADEATNSIIINASDAVYNNLRLVIEKLDVRRAQVYVEALIVEMTADRTDELGIQWAGGGQRGSRTVGGMTNFPGAGPGIAEVAANPSAGITAAGLSFAILGPKITLANGTTVRNLAGLARALEATSMANILSTPTLLTLDNASARIVVGQNVPFVTGSFAQATAAVAGGPVNPFQTIERRDVGLTLKLKPQISEGGMIRLEIYQEVSSVDPTSRGLASDVVLNKRALETKVVIDDGNTIVLVGLIDNRVTESVQAVPLLGSIPLLGALFRFKRSVVARTNLMIFLRPVIVRSADDGYRVTADRYEYLRAYAPEGAEREAIFDRLAPVAPGVGVPPRATDPVPPGAAPRDPGRETAPEPAKP
jgi:general secretion pathway protein D